MIRYVFLSLFLNEALSYLKVHKRSKPHLLCHVFLICFFSHSFSVNKLALSLLAHFHKGTRRKGFREEEEKKIK